MAWIDSSTSRRENGLAIAFERVSMAL